MAVVELAMTDHVAYTEMIINFFDLGLDAQKGCGFLK